MPADSTPFARAEPRARAFLLAGATLLAAAPADALTIRCVGTSSQLGTALAQASAAQADSPFLIQLRTGTYQDDGLPANAFVLAPQRPGQVIELSGGWSGPNGTCQTRGYGPARSTLKGSTNRPALNVNLGTSVSGVQFHLHDVDFSNPFFNAAEYGACLRGVVEAGNAMLVERVATHQCNAPNGTHAAAYLINGGELTMRSVAVRSGTAMNNGGIGLHGVGSGVSRLAQISVTATQSSGSPSFASGIALRNMDVAVTHLANSVIWGNDPDADMPDLWLSGSRFHLTRVHYGSLYGTPTTNVAPGSGDPGFAAPGDPHLHPYSILIDSGTPDPAGGAGLFDLEGNARVRGAAIDVGAYESPASDFLFEDGFDRGID